ncbi:unnamed protein product [Urochloa humidicola]
MASRLANNEAVVRRASTIQHDKEVPSLLRKWAGKGFFGSWGVEFFDVTRIPVTDDLMLLVLDKLLLKASRKEWDSASFRGERALEEWMGSHQGPEPGRSSGYAALHMSVGHSRVDFPTSVLIWHIATDNCYFSAEDDKGGDIDPDEMKKKMMMMSRELSLYITYLVFKCDVMLTSISRLAHKNAHEGLKIIFCLPPQINRLDEKEAVKEVFKATMKNDLHQQCCYCYYNQQSDGAGTSAEHEGSATLSSVVPCQRSGPGADVHQRRSCPLGPHLGGLAGDAFLHGASLCGAAFHYEHLSTGGEFITHVLLLMRSLGPFMPKPGA